MDGRSNVDVKTPRTQTGTEVQNHTPPQPTVKDDDGPSESAQRVSTVVDAVDGSSIVDIETPLTQTGIELQYPIADCSHIAPSYPAQASREFVLVEPHPRANFRTPLNPSSSPRP